MGPSLTQMILQFGHFLLPPSIWLKLQPNVTAYKLKLALLILGLDSTPNAGNGQKHFGKMFCAPPPHFSMVKILTAPPPPFRRRRIKTSHVTPPPVL